MTQMTSGFLLRFDRNFAWGLRQLCGVLLSTIVVVMTWQVLSRYIPGAPSPNWAEELSLMILVWLGMLATGLVLREGDNLAVDMFTRQLPVQVQHLVHRFVWLLVSAFGVYLIHDGITLTNSSMNQTFSTMPLAVGYMYLAMPVGGVLVFLYSVRNLFSRWSQTDTSKGSWLAVVIPIVLLSMALLFGTSAVFSPVGVLLLGFLICLMLGVPIGMAVGIATLLATLRAGVPMLIVAQRMVNGITVTPLLAIPFFILVGQIMSEGGIARRLVDLARVIVGPFRGGLAMVNVLDSMLMGGVSGSAVADVSATGGIIIPMMIKKGYDPEFATALTVASSVQGVIIPPSHNMVIYSLAAGGVSIGTLFLAGYVPGIMTGLALMVASYIIAMKRGYPTEPRPPYKESLHIVFDAIPSLLVGLIIVGGISFGWFTATESSAIGVSVALFISFFIYKEMTVAKLWQSILATVNTVAVVMFVIATASAFGWLIAYLSLPAQLSSLILSISDNPIILLLLINLLLLGLGAIMDMAPLIVILTPVLLPIVTADPINMHSVHFGIVLMLNLGLGLTTPPVGTALFVGCSIAGIKVEQVSKSLLYLWPAMLLVLLLVTYFPWFVNVLPNALGKA